ncbi:hypothetical protein F4805DRAFT_200431 [Annulohypoxylon moriforme]|nr:hypothetical protein F4805DRAFT_200431 [Annulohypoxylon moriforme]
MVTKNSRQRREAFCRRAKRRDAALRSLYAGGITRSQHPQQIWADMPSTVTFNTQHIMSRTKNGFGQPSQPTIVPRSLAPARIFEHALFSNTSVQRPANSLEIYCLAFLTCLLAFLLLWLSLTLARGTFSRFRNLSNTPSQRMDPESGPMPEHQTPEENGPFLSNFRNVSSEAEELIKSARRASANVATVLKREMGDLRRRTHSTRRRVDEEEALGDTGGDGTETKCSFLPQT